MDTYFYEELQIKKSDNSRFSLHSHDTYEILVFFEGDSRYVIEDKVYTLQKDDVIIIRKHEMHRIFHNSPSPYHRLVIMVSPSFFTEKNCPEYEEAFLGNAKYLGNKIDGRIVHKSGLFDAVMRLKKYSDSFTLPPSPVTDAVITEILYIINKTVSFSEPDNEDNRIANVIAYINESFTQDISLDTLSEKFFISKYHLCRIFKEATGHTIHSYIKNKRLILAKEMIECGHSMTDAASLSGFNNYSSFYRAYKGKI